MEFLTKDGFLQKVFNYEQNKEWKFEGELPCIIDFYADWCGPCKMVEPVLQELAAAFGIQSIPSILFVPLNDKPQMAVGALPKNSIKKAINEILNIAEN